MQFKIELLPAKNKTNQNKKSVTTSDFTQMGKTDDKWPRPVTAVQGTDYSERRKEFKYVFEGNKVKLRKKCKRIQSHKKVFFLMFIFVLRSTMIMQSIDSDLQNKIFYCK